MGLQGQNLGSSRIGNARPGAIDALQSVQPGSAGQRFLKIRLDAKRKQQETEKIMRDKERPVGGRRSRFTEQEIYDVFRESNGSLPAPEKRG